MKTIRVELNDELAESLSTIVRQGLFTTEEEVIRFALIAFVDEQKLALMERFQQEDIAWALDQKNGAG